MGIENMKVGVLTAEQMADVIRQIVAGADPDEVLFALGGRNGRAAQGNGRAAQSNGEAEDESAPEVDYTDGSVHSPCPVCGVTIEEQLAHAAGRGDAWREAFEMLAGFAFGD